MGQLGQLGDEVAEDALAGALNHVQAAVEVLSVPEVGVVDFERLGFDCGGVELAQETYLR